MNKQFTKYEIATSIAILFHAIGLFGLLIFEKDFFIRSTPFNLLLMFVLLIWTQTEKNTWFWVFLSACFFIGVFVEIIGVNTGILFGNYEYGNVLGIKFKKVPLLIGVNWFIIIYCCGVSVQTLLTKIINNLPSHADSRSKTIKALSVVVDGATLAVVFDWLMEPVAIKLNYWQWHGSIPIYNYVCWFFVSILLLIIFHSSKFAKQNKFAVNLLLIQVMFFLVLRNFMN